MRWQLHTASDWRPKIWRKYWRINARLAPKVWWKDCRTWQPHAAPSSRRWHSQLSSGRGRIEFVLHSRMLFLQVCTCGNLSILYIPHGSRRWQPLPALPRREKFSHWICFGALPVVMLRATMLR
ncbi:hypothetical protein PIB30_035821, partial [Stylosanthes scabra]|nr:hypothetical protein [Stylosanthes scabra]